MREEAPRVLAERRETFIPPPRHSAALLFAYDVVVVVLASLAALMIRFDSTDFSASVAPYLPTALIPVLVRPISFLAFGLYRREWLYASMREIRDLVVAVVAGSIAIVMLYIALDVAGAPGTEPFPRSFFGLEALLSLVGVATGRFLVRISLERRTTAVRGIGGATELSTLVYGAGEAGAFVGRLAAAGTLAGVRVVGYLDDDRRKQGSRLLGHRVLGDLGGLDRAFHLTCQLKN